MIGALAKGHAQVVQAFLDLAVVSHLCNRLAVMNEGRVLEELRVEDLSANRPAHPYTRELFDASASYDRWRKERTA